jgi:hypothetical protein
LEFRFHRWRNIFIFLNRFLIFHIKRFHLLPTFFVIYIRICFLDTNAFLHGLLLFRNNSVKRYRIINYLFLFRYSLQLVLSIRTTCRLSWFLRFSNLIISYHTFARSSLIIIDHDFFIQVIIFRNPIWRMDSLWW